jgi:DNA-binding transcriptional ArsR family regulator
MSTHATTIRDGDEPEIPRQGIVAIDNHYKGGAIGLESGSSAGSQEVAGSPAIQLAQLGRALGHPLRVEILTALLFKDEASPRELAELLGHPLGTVSYHVRYLVTLEMLQLERMVPRRGAVQHFYSLKDELRRLLPAAAAVLAEPTAAEGDAVATQPDIES